MNEIIIDVDEIPLTFGKYAGYTPEQVAQADPEYIVDMYDTMPTKPCSKPLRDLCEMDVRESADTWMYETEE